MGDDNYFTSNNISGGAGSGGENYELPKMIEEEADCRCRIPCPVCGGCLMTDVPVGCEPCSCPEAPQKVDLCSSGQNGLYRIIDLYKYICELFGINSDINVRTDNLVDVEHCIKSTGTGGAFKNGDGYIGGIYVRWQVSYAGLDNTDQYLSFRLTNEPNYYRANLKYDGKNDQPGITLVFETADDRYDALKAIPCFNF